MGGGREGGGVSECGRIHRVHGRATASASLR